jgi:tetratricopeptide (TPR) repeat protein
LSRGRWIWSLLTVALLAVYGYRTVEGVRAGWLFDRGRLLRSQGNYPESAPRLEASAVGGIRARGLLIAGEVRLDLWEAQVRDGGPLGADSNELIRAAEDFLACRCAAPATRRAWKGLGEVYDAIEWIGRERRAERPYVVPEHPWARVGRPGRVAIGLLRMTSDLSPNWSQLQDRLALTLWNYGLHDLAREAVRASARMLPVYHRHPYREIDELPRWVDEEFARGSREVLGKVPLYPRANHLVELGKLERRLGAEDRALPLLEEALALGGDELRLAEIHYHLGLASVGIGHHEKGIEHLERAGKHPVFRASALSSLASVAEERGDLETALAHLRHLRWEEPNRLEPCLRFAAVARKLGDWPAALESLRWAKLKHREDVRPYVALADTLLEMDDAPAATAVAEELAQVVGNEAPEVVGLRARISGMSRGSRRPSR